MTRRTTSLLMAMIAENDQENPELKTRARKKRTTTMKKQLAQSVPCVAFQASLPSMLTIGLRRFARDLSLTRMRTKRKRKMAMNLMATCVLLSRGSENTAIAKRKHNSTTKIWSSLANNSASDRSLRPR